MRSSSLHPSSSDARNRVDNATHAVRHQRGARRHSWLCCYMHDTRRHTTPRRTACSILLRRLAPARPHHCAGSRGSPAGGQCHAGAACAVCSARMGAAASEPGRPAPHATQRNMQRVATYNMQHVATYNMHHVATYNIHHVATYSMQPNATVPVPSWTVRAQPGARSTLGRSFAAAAWRTRAGWRAAQWSVHAWACPLISSGTYTVAAPVGGRGDSKARRRSHSAARRCVAGRAPPVQRVREQPLSARCRVRVRVRACDSR
jgi:hypothetical protein